VKIKDDDGNEVTCGKRIAKKFPSNLRTTLRYIMLTSSSLWKPRMGKNKKERHLIKVGL
jgi:hypothetical protein